MNEKKRNFYREVENWQGRRSKKGSKERLKSLCNIWKNDRRLVANLHSANSLAARRKGLERKSRRICISKSEELERKARFLALCAKNAPK